jgi:RNA polymerase sigma-70 factor (ECF subfamily)
MPDTSDETLVHTLASGDDCALRLLMERHERRVRAFLARRLPSWEDAEEAAQDVFLRVRRGASSFNGNLAFGPWFVTIARNVLRDRLRRHRREHRLPMAPDPLEALTVWERPVDGGDVLAALADLPRIYRSALTLKYLADLSYREAADAAGISEKGFETRLARARVRLRQALRARQRGIHGLSGL